MEIIHTKSDIERALEKSDFVTETCLQINKDLISISKEISVEKDTHPLKSFSNQLISIFQELDDLEKLAQFIYRVDLNEVDFKNDIVKADWAELAYLVIRREAQKVYLRKRFK